MTRPGPDAVDEQKPSPSVFTLLGLGISLAVCVAAGLLLGLVVDAATKLSPLFTLVGLLLGVGLAVVTAYIQIRKFL